MQADWTGARNTGDKHTILSKRVFLRHDFVSLFALGLILITPLKSRLFASVAIDPSITLPKKTGDPE
jgi:hypothetical protein